jgi:RimJ/RimL family protein N-acetyltransferase
VKHPGPSDQDAVVTTRLLVRPVVRSDANAYADLIDDTIPANGFPEHYQRDVRLAVKRGRLVGARVLANLSDGRIVGMISSYTLDQMIHDRCEIGFFVGSEHRGRGYALEAIEGFVGHLHACGYQVVEASTAVDNDVVRRLLTRAGFVAVNEYRRTLPNGVEIDAVRFEHPRPVRADSRADAPI